jgi:hypothetical protein
MGVGGQGQNAMFWFGARGVLRARSLPPTLIRFAAQAHKGRREERKLNYPQMTQMKQMMKSGWREFCREE